MGRDKSLLPFDKSPTLTHYQYQRLKKIFEKVYISCKDPSKFDFEDDFIVDVVDTDIYAPTVGFVSIYKEIKDSSFFVLSVDSPFVSKDIIYKLFREDDENVDATIALTPIGMQPLCGIYHRSLEKKFNDMLDGDNHKLGYLLKNSNTKFVRFENEDEFLNLNHPDEYKKAQQIIRPLV